MKDKNTRKNEYRLLYFSPRPEDGEQVCVAVVEHVDGKWTVDFDEKLLKLRAIARARDVDFVRSVLDSFRAELNGYDVSLLMRSIEPQFHLSAPRELIVTWSDEVRRLLRKRFLQRGRQLTGIQEHQHQQEMQKKLSKLIAELRPGVESYMTLGVRPDQILGSKPAKEFRNPKPIATAIISRTRAILIDGVDTSEGDSTTIVKRANGIAFTFWQYGKLSKEKQERSDLLRHIIRVGIVFDGHPRSSMLREYSLHQFKKDADIAVEADADQNFENVRTEIERTIADITI